MNDVFGDIEPEDAWHPDDPVDELIDNLRRRLPLLGEPGDLDGDDRTAMVETIAARVANAARRRDLSARDLLRLADLDVDIAHVRARLGDGRR